MNKIKGIQIALLLLSVMLMNGCSAGKNPENIEIPIEKQQEEVAPDDEKQTAEASIDEELTAIEEQEKELLKKLQEEDITQMDMTITSSEILTLWDDELNSIWSRLNNCLPEEEMGKLLDEQRAWIKQKEQESKEAGAECEGGSIQPMIINDYAAEMTKKRVYELAKLLQ